ncbi:MAG: RNA polymerase sigma factor [Chloroflexi bacterium]|nr:RNA polymerase sigma factor [Chloroflexota bacterium]
MTGPHLDTEEAALRRLVLHCDDGDGVARVVIDQVVPRLMLFLRRRFVNLAADDVYDVAAEALSVAIERRATFDAARTAKVRTWLYGIAQIKAADFLRRRGSQVRLPADVDVLEEESSLGGSDEDDGAAASSRHPTAQRLPPAHRPAAAGTNGYSSVAGEQAAVAELIRGALFALPAQQRKAAIARYIDELLPEDIDRLYGWKRNTAHVYLSLARKAIRRRLSEAGIGDVSAGGRVSKARPSPNTMEQAAGAIETRAADGALERVG